MKEISDFDRIIKNYEQQNINKRYKGNKFENLIKNYLKIDGRYNFENIYLWKDFPYKYDFSDGHDIGIDLVAEDLFGNYWAIQAKCYGQNTSIDKSDVDTFLTTSSRSFYDRNSKKVKFSKRLWVSTTNKWTKNAEETLKNQEPEVIRLNRSELENANVNFSELECGNLKKALKEHYKVKPHQEEAILKSIEYFDNHDRGKLIMACGTGKTFTSLKISEKMALKNKIVLFLVPSIALLSQNFREWSTHAETKINPICICSDRNVSKPNEDLDISKIDLGYPATTNANEVFEIYEKYKINQSVNRIVVIFSTYQSIDTVSKAQKLGLPEFDLIICDEAHRTTGAKLKNEEESTFSKIHDNNFVKGAKRLYMTATPRIYDENSKSKAKQNNVILCSMDNTEIYGEQIHRIGFGSAVDKGLLSDYKVLVLTIQEENFSDDLKKRLANYHEENHEKITELQFDDDAKIIGCINALSKNLIGGNQELINSDIEPMKRAVAFCENIKASKIIKDKFNKYSEIYRKFLENNEILQDSDIKIKVSKIFCDHIDGTMNSPRREELLSKLKNQNEVGKCQILSNVRCLSEGVDVPALDAVLFLSPRNSQIEVTQSVGRVMRNFEGKKYGYIIIPVVVPDDVTPENSLDDNRRYKTVWSVLNALRAHDDRLTDNIIKEIQLNKRKPQNIDVVGLRAPCYGKKNEKYEQLELNLNNFKKLQSLLFAKLVKKVGTKTYWESWEKDAAEIAKKIIKKLKEKLEKPEYKENFYDFLNGLKKNVNSEITEQEAVEMLAQHIITEPVFQSLFDDYSFIENNPISIAMRNTIEHLKTNATDMFSERDGRFEEFYKSVKRRTSGIITAEGRQKVIIDLYDNFFKTAFPKMSGRFGIVYTPIEIVDFIINSLNDVLKNEFRRSLSDKNVNIIDPFTGTGTFIVRLIQSGLINKENLKYKYKNEIFANEIVLLAYYIAAINIENAYKDAVKSEFYLPFEGICLTDTFQTAENDDCKSSFFPVNSKRIERENEVPLTIFLGNPPYSAGQKNINDNAPNKKYTKLDKKIRETYSKNSSAQLKRSLYDSYIRAFRHATDRLGNNDGIICYVSNGSWLDGNATDGFRKTIENEFAKIYIFNLRGAWRKGSAEIEGENVFGDKCSCTVAITLLIKRKNYNQKAKIIYSDIANMGYKLKCKEKLQKIKELKSFTNPEIDRKILKPRENADWIVKRNDNFLFIPLNCEKKFNENSNSFFTVYSRGICSGNDSSIYNFSQKKLIQNLEKLKKIEFINKEKFYISSYRPFIKQKLYFEKELISRRYQNHKLFPTSETKNLIICTTSIGVNKKFSSLMTDKITDLGFNATTQCFPFHYFEINNTNSQIKFGENSKETYVKKDGISDFVLKSTREKYDDYRIKKIEIFYYIYGFLHAPNYRKTFAEDLKRSLPKIPLVDKKEDFWKFSKSGRELAGIHLNYENFKKNKNVKVIGDNGNYEVKKMRFISKDDKTKIVYNNDITIENIPMIAYEYVVNGKSAIEWIMDRYQIRIDKASHILNDPNDWSKEQKNPSYILGLLLSLIEVSTKTIEIVKNLPDVVF